MRNFSCPICRNQITPLFMTQIQWCSTCSSIVSHCDLCAGYLIRSFLGIGFYGGKLGVANRANGINLRQKPIFLPALTNFHRTETELKQFHHGFLPTHSHIRVLCRWCLRDCQEHALIARCKVSRRFLSNLPGIICALPIVDEECSTLKGHWIFEHDGGFPPNVNKADPSDSHSLEECITKVTQYILFLNTSGIVGRDYAWDARWGLDSDGILFLGCQNRWDQGYKLFVARLGPDRFLTFDYAWHTFSANNANP